MNPRWRARGRHRLLGQALVEFALVSPVLLFFLLGIVDFGRAVSSFIAVSEGAREGARAGIYATATDDDIRNTVRLQSPMLGTLSDANISITPAYPRGSGDNLAVGVSCDLEIYAPLINLIWGGGPLHLSDTARMKVE